MSKKVVYDNTLLYDNNRIDAINSQVKQSSLYSGYIWTNCLHAIDSTPNPGQRPEFQMIIHELDKHREKHAKASTENNHSTLAASGAYIATAADSTESSKLKLPLSHSEPLLHKPVSGLLQFENMYKEIFEDLQPLSAAVARKQQQFSSSVLNMKKELYPHLAGRVGERVNSPHSDY